MKTFYEQGRHRALEDLGFSKEAGSKNIAAQLKRLAAQAQQAQATRMPITPEQLFGVNRVAAKASGQKAARTKRPTHALQAITSGRVLRQRARAFHD